MMARIDPQRVADVAARAGFSVFWAFAKCHQGSAYYPTRIGHQHRGLRGRDLLGEMICAFAARGIPCVIYYSACSDAWVADRHANWCQRDSEGRALPIVGVEDFPWVCLNSPYREYLLGQLRELAGGYEGAGVFLDRVGWAPGACYCPHCQRAFRQETGDAIPDRDEWQTELGRAFIRWRSSVLHEFLRQARAVSKEGHPDWMFSHNLYSELREKPWRGQMPERDTVLDDVVLVEAFDDYTFEWVRNAAYARALSKKRPIVSLGRFVGPMWDWTTKPRAHLMAQVLTPLANGCEPMLIDSFFPDGHLDPLAYEEMGQVVAEVGRRIEWVVDAEPLTYAAMYVSMATRLHYADDDPARYLHDFDGAFKMLTDEHTLTDVLSGQALNGDCLGAYRVLVLANVACLSDEQIRAIEEYVAHGGGLVATGATSIWDEHGRERQDFGLRDVLGVSYHRPLNYSSSFVALEPGSPIGEG
jgi:hypothetical protein